MLKPPEPRHSLNMISAITPGCANVLSVAVGSGSVSGDVTFQRGSGSGEVNVPVHAAELLRRLDHPCSSPARVLRHPGQPRCSHRRRLLCVCSLRQPRTHFRSGTD